MDCPSALSTGLINFLEICGSIFGLTFVIGGLAYLVLTLVLGYFGYLAYATAKLGPAQKEFTEKRKERLTEMQPILRNLLSVKTLGLQAYYLADLTRRRSEEIEALKRLREQSRLISNSLSPSFSLFSLVVLCGLAYQHYDRSTSAENIFPALLVIAYLGECNGRVKLSLASWADLEYLKRLAKLLNEDEIPLRFKEPKEKELQTYPHAQITNQTEAETGAGAEPEVELDPGVQLRVRNLTSKHTFKRDEVFLKAVNIQLFRGDFALIYGRTGSGKTTFLETILGEQSLSTGSIHVADASLAYCGQDTWLPDTSIQLCITGGNVVYETRYRAAVTACRLPVEMSSLAYSSATKIGPNGCYLSRTVRAKMILARAAYAGASIVLLDDSFAAFDAAEATELARTLLNPTDGFLRMRHATVILASHSFAMPAFTDVVYSLAINQFIDYPTEVESENTNLVSAQNNPPLAAPSAERGILSISRTDLTLPRGKNGCNNNEEAQRVSLQKNMAFIWNVMADKAGWTKFLLYLSCFVFTEILVTLCTAAWPQLHLPLPASVGIQVIIGLLYHWLVFKAFGSIDQLQPELWELSHKKIATMIMTSRPSRTFHLSSTQMLNLLDTDLQVLDDSLRKLFLFTYHLGWLIFLLSVLFWSTNRSISAVLMTVICVATLEHAWSGASKRASELSDHAVQRLNAKFAEVTDGLATIRGFCWQNHQLQQVLGIAQESETALETALSLEPWFEMSMALCWTVLVTNFVAYAFCHPNQISPNMLGLGLLAIIAFLPLAKNTLSISMDVKELITSTDRIRRFMIVPEEPGRVGCDPTAGNESWGEIQEIVFEKAEIGANAPLNGKIRGFGQVLLQGCNGTGKTSLLLALLGKHEYTGSIRVGGVEVRDLKSDVIRKFVSVLPQDPVALPGTLKQNLFLTQYTNPDLELEPIEKSLTGILDKLDLLHLTDPDSEGYDKLVSDMRLSPGQIALMNLARCAIDVVRKKSRIVVIDDMFSKLDRQYADMARKFINRAFRACIVIVAEASSDTRLSVEGLTPLYEEYANPRAFDLAYLAAVDREVGRYHEALRDDMKPLREPSMTEPPASTSDPSLPSPSSLLDASSSLDPDANASPLPNPSSVSAPPPPPPPRPINPNNPFFEPRRPALRPPTSKGKEVAQDDPNDPILKPQHLAPPPPTPEWKEVARDRILTTYITLPPIHPKVQAEREGTTVAETERTNTGDDGNPVGADGQPPNQAAPGAVDMVKNAAHDENVPFGKLPRGYPGVYPEDDDDTGT